MVPLQMARGYRFFVRGRTVSSLAHCARCARACRSREKSSPFVHAKISPLCAMSRAISRPRSYRNRWLQRCLQRSGAAQLKLQPTNTGAIGTQSGVSAQTSRSSVIESVEPLSSGSRSRSARADMHGCSPAVLVVARSRNVTDQVVLKRVAERSYQALRHHERRVDAAHADVDHAHPAPRVTGSEADGR